MSLSLALMPAAMFMVFIGIAARGVADFTTLIRCGFSVLFIPIYIRHDYTRNFFLRIN